jgi:hypothetical protein
VARRFAERKNLLLEKNLSSGLTANVFWVWRHRVYLIHHTHYARPDNSHWHSTSYLVRLQHVAPATPPTNKDIRKCERPLARNIPVVPVLIDGAPMPDIDLLPDDLKGLVDRQAEFVEYRTFDADASAQFRDWPTVCSFCSRL